MKHLFLILCLTITSVLNSQNITFRTQPNMNTIKRDVTINTAAIQHHYNRNINSTHGFYAPSTRAWVDDGDGDEIGFNDGTHWKDPFTNCYRCGGSGCISGNLHNAQKCPFCNGLGGHPSHVPLGNGTLFLSFCLILYIGIKFYIVKKQEMLN